MSAAIKKRLEVLADAYWQAFEKLADDVRASHVIPYCDRVGARFLSGMGGYSFTLKDGTNLGEWNGREVPQYLRNVLDQTGIETNTCLGAYMSDYTPEGWKAK